MMGFGVGRKPGNPEQLKTISAVRLSNKCKNSYQIQLRRTYQYFSSQANPARENWTWSYPYSN